MDDSSLARVATAAGEKQKAETLLPSHCGFLLHEYADVSVPSGGIGAGGVRQGWWEGLERRARH